MTAKISVYSDYVCPLCFLAKQSLYEAFKEKDDIDIQWTPFEQSAQADTFQKEERILYWKETVYPLAEKMGVPITLPDVTPYPSSRLASEGYYFAKAHGKAREYTDRLMDAFFQEQQNIGQVEVLSRLAAEIGLDQQAYEEALKQRLYEETHKNELDRAHNEANVTSVPALIAGCTKLSGVPVKEALEQLINQEQKPKKKKVTLLMNGPSCGINGCQ